MDIHKVLSELDTFFDQGQLERIEPFLKEKYEQACAEGDDAAALSLLNEQIGFYREMTKREDAWSTAEKILHLIEKAGFEGTLSEATSLVNVATAYRFLGDYRESEKLYEKVAVLYKGLLEPGDMLWASLYNNSSILYNAMGDYEKSKEKLLQALAIVENVPGHELKTAITLTNLGQAYFELQDFKQAEEALHRAEMLFEKFSEKKDSHYCGCANALGALYHVLGQNETAVHYYEEALLNIYETAGVTDNYHTIYENMMQARRDGGMPEYASVLDLCEGFYKEYVAPMILDKFPKYEKRIAVGLFGEGSECFGFEDSISLDHDCGPGFVMLLDDELYDEIGEELQKAYESLPKIFAGRIRRESWYSGGRVGVCTIEKFFYRVLEGHPIPQKDEEWASIPEYALACATNGRVFHDPFGVVTQIRETLAGYYPDAVWKERLARTLLRCAQTGQYNYGRMMARQDYVTAQIVLSDYMREIMQCVFLINRKYAPYYKWMHKAMSRLEILPEIGDFLRAICDMPSQREAWENVIYKAGVNEQDMVAMTIEIIAKLITNELQEMGLSKSDDLYLETQGREVAKS